MLFSQEVTESEANLGFRLAYIANPKIHFSGQPSIIKAAIKPIQRSYRMMKLRAPDGSAGYPIHCFCKYNERTRKADWHPVISGMYSPELTLIHDQCNVVYIET